MIRLCLSIIFGFLNRLFNLKPYYHFNVIETGKIFRAQFVECPSVTITGASFDDLSRNLQTYIDLMMYKMLRHDFVGVYAKRSFKQHYQCLISIRPMLSFKTLIIRAKTKKQIAKMLKLLFLGYLNV